MDSNKPGGDGIANLSNYYNHLDSSNARLIPAYSLLNIIAAKLIMLSLKEILVRIIDKLNKAFTIKYGEVNTFVDMEIKRNRDKRLITIP